MSIFSDPVLSGQFLKSRGWPLYAGSTVIITKVRQYGRLRSKVETPLLQRCALRKFHVTDDQNTRDQITSVEIQKARDAG